MGAAAGRRDGESSDGSMLDPGRSAYDGGRAGTARSTRRSPAASAPTPGRTRPRGGRAASSSACAGRAADAGTETAATERAYVALASLSAVEGQSCLRASVLEARAAPQCAQRQQPAGLVDDDGQRASAVPCGTVTARRGSATCRWPTRRRAARRQALSRRPTVLARRRPPARRGRAAGRRLAARSPLQRRGARRAAAVAEAVGSSRYGARPRSSAPRRSSRPAAAADAWVPRLEPAREPVGRAVDDRLRRERCASTAAVASGRDGRAGAAGPVGPGCRRRPRPRRGRAFRRRWSGVAGRCLGGASRARLRRREPVGAAAHRSQDLPASALARLVVVPLRSRGPPARPGAGRGCRRGRLRRVQAQSGSPTTTARGRRAPAAPAGTGRAPPLRDSATGRQVRRPAAPRGPARTPTWSNHSCSAAAATSRSQVAGPVDAARGRCDRRRPRPPRRGSRRPASRVVARRCASRATRPCDPPGRRPAGGRAHDRERPPLTRATRRPRRLRGRPRPARRRARPPAGRAGHRGRRRGVRPRGSAGGGASRWAASSAAKSVVPSRRR